MARRADPERIYQARWHAVRSRLTRNGMSDERAEAWITAWEQSPEARSMDRLTAGFWEACDAWLTAAQKSSRQPPTRVAG